MSNLYSASGKGEEAVEMRMKMKMKMKKRELKKQPKYSWITVGNQMHTFIVADMSHLLFEALGSVVTDLGNKMRMNMTTEAADTSNLSCLVE
ncbi:hypothetical protein YC2023_028188 [Brassica napus]